MKGWIGKSVLLLGSLLISLGLSEVVLRALPPETLGFQYHPGRRRFETLREFQRDDTKNSLGLHDVEPPPKQPGRLRVMLLGDSYIASHSVLPALNVGQRTQYHLDQLGVPAQVVSVGKEGWGQREELEALRQYGPDIAPDVIVTLFLPLNDVENNSELLKERTQEQQRDPNVMFRPGWSRRSADTMPLFWFERSVLNQLITYRLAMRANRNRGAMSIPVDYFVYSAQPDEDWERAWAATEALILETAAEAESLGAQYAVASASTPQGVLGPEAGLAALTESYPAMKALDWDLLAPERRIEAICRRHGIPFLGLAPRFREETKSGRRLHWPVDGHWNEEGNDLAGEMLAELIRELDSGNGSSSSP